MGHQLYIVWEPVFASSHFTIKAMHARRKILNKDPILNLQWETGLFIAFSIGSQASA